jgi:hypothetical protein
MSKIFMSHSSQDKDFVRRLSVDLKTSGHEPWLDEWEIKVGECIVSKISEGIQDADYAVLVLTPESVASGWVDREWKTMYWSEIQKANLKVLPILLRKCQIPTLLQTKRYADFTTRYEIGFSQLLDTISLDASSKPTTYSNKSNRSARFQRKEPREITLSFEFVQSGQILEAQVPINLMVAELKREVMNEMSYSDQFLDGRIASTHIYSKTRNMRLDENISLNDNGVRDGETLQLLFECCAG